MSKKILFLIVVAALLAIAGCKDTDNASKWTGTYITGAGGAHPNTFYQIVIQEGDNKTIRVLADTVVQGAVFTYVTIQNCAVQSSSAATFSETDSVVGFNHPLLLNGTATLNGSVLTIQGTGVNAYDTVDFYFYGAKL